jgi:hypothetical protein
MVMSTLVTRTLVVTALAATAALAPAAAASAASTIPCASGYVCVGFLKGTIVSVPEGQSASFPTGPTMAGIVNQTKTSYCVAGNPNFALGAGSEILRTQTITGFGPGRFCIL